MRNYYYILLALLGVGICLGSCKRASDSGEKDILTDKTFKSEIALATSDSVIVDQVFRLFELTVVDNRMIIVDGAAEDTVINVFTYPECKKVQSCFTCGEGPDQFIVVNTGEPINKDNVLIYDMMKHKLCLINTKNQPMNIESEFQLPVDEEGMGLPFTYINQCNDSLFLMKYDDPDISSRYLADLKNNKILWKETTPYRDDKYNYAVYDYLQMMSDSTAIVAYTYMDLVEIYNVSIDNGMELKAQYGAYKDLSKTEKFSKIYQDIAHDSKVFYCLRANVEHGFGTIVEAYDIATCRPLNTYILDKPVSKIAIYNNELIGYYPGEQASIFYKWEL